jgi:hypothetical protein
MNARATPRDIRMQPLARFGIIARWCVINFGGVVPSGQAPKRSSKVLQFGLNLLSHLAPKMHRFAAKSFICLKSVELPKLHDDGKGKLLSQVGDKS